MNLLRFTVLLVIALALAACAAAPPTPRAESRVDWGQYFAAYNLEGAFVLYDPQTAHYQRYNPIRCAERFIPASTFKLPHALIALETDIVPDEYFTLAWDGTEWPSAAWNQDQTFESALQNSVVWYFQELARREGAERLQYYVDAIGYGNQNIGGNLDSFWLDGDLRISADEQIAFLERLYRETLPFKPHAQQLVKTLLRVEDTPDYRMTAKTGWATRVSPQIGWYIGYIEKAGAVYFFALNVESAAPGPDFSEARFAITRSLLQNAGILP